MLADLLGSKTRARLVSALLDAPDHQLHFRALLRVTGTSIAGVQRELERLETMGLVESQHDDAGRRQVRLVASHPFAGPLAALVAAEPPAVYSPARAPANDVERDVLGALNPRVRPLVPVLLEAAAKCAVSRISLFGSSTQVEPDIVPQDLDVAVRFNPDDPRPPSDLYFDLASELSRVSGLPVDLVEIDAVRNPYLREQIRDTEVVLRAES